MKGGNLSVPIKRRFHFLAVCDHRAEVRGGFQGNC